MEEGTQSSPIFERSAQDLADRLEPIASEQARAMAREARALVETFQSWARRRPEDGARIDAIQSLFELNRRAMDFLSRNSSPPTSGPASSPGPGPSSRR